MQNKQSTLTNKAGYTRIHSLSCDKLSPTAKGKLRYEIWQHNDDGTKAICISHNESSGGFSNELIELTAIINHMDGLTKLDKPFHATVLKDLFTGKSVNNHCFLAAVLVQEDVLKPHALSPRLLQVHESYAQWPIRVDQYSSQVQADKPINPSQDKTTKVQKNHATRTKQD